MDISILSLRTQDEAQALMKEIGADPGGIQIMAPKTVANLARINRLPIFAANILKQESLSLGADTAVSREALTGKAKWTDCLIIGNLAHFSQLCAKLKKQPCGLNKVADELRCAISNYQRNNFILESGRYKLNLNSHTHIMGIINMTPDSFSGDGLLRNKGYGIRDTDVLEYAQKLVNEGADILDIGGESSRPGAKQISVKEELQRVIPAVKKITKKIKVPVSIDTYKSEVARQALDNGAAIVNDISALGADPRMSKLIRKHKALVVLMHMKGSARSMQRNPRYLNVMEEIIRHLSKAISAALDAGIDFEKIIIDPGIGFGKALEHNLEIIKSLDQLKTLGRPILAGTSRKSFIGKITKTPPAERLSGSISSNCLCALNGARLLRVHDVKEMKQALLVLDSILKC